MKEHYGEKIDPLNGAEVGRTNRCAVKIQSPARPFREWEAGVFNGLYLITKPGAGSLSSYRFEEG